MHLLQRHGDSFRLVYHQKDVPRYAILSHTWGEFQDEVTFQDMINGTGTMKAGYRKIIFCANQAAIDKLDFFWIDTCCIDKSSSHELQEAIRCMFRWYRDSEKCYVFLDDVPGDELAEESMFRSSRWFKRGWTLQELLAPKCVEFFSTEGSSLGSKLSRMQAIAEVTHIPTEALQGRDLSRFSVHERMVWVRGRKTTREEDIAYSLLGIFNIQMSLFYGEGRESAFERLHKKIAGRIHGGEDFNLRSDHFKFALQTSTMLHEANEQCRLLIGKSDQNGRPDLIAVKMMGPGHENVEINVLYGAFDYQRMILRILSRNFTPYGEDWITGMDFALTDWNGDGTLDLVVIKKSSTGTKSTEVHIFSGASKFQHLLLQVGTPLGETDDSWAFGMGKWGPGRKPDLFAICKSNTGTKTTEVHVLSGDCDFQDFNLQIGTGLHETNSEFDFVVTDWNGDGISDLVIVKSSRTRSECTEVYVLSGASEYKEFILRTETPLFETFGCFEFAVADWPGNRKPALIALKKDNTGANAAEVHVLVQQK